MLASQKVLQADSSQEVVPRVPSIMRTVFYHAKKTTTLIFLPHPLPLAIKLEIYVNLLIGSNPPPHTHTLVTGPALCPGVLMTVIIIIITTSFLYSATPLTCSWRYTCFFPWSFGPVRSDTNSTPRGVYSSAATFMQRKKLLKHTSHHCPTSIMR